MPAARRRRRARACGARTLLLTHKLDDHRRDVVQPGDRRARARPSGARDRCARRRDGARDRSRRHPVPRAQPQQGAGGARAARAGRPPPVPSRDRGAARRAAEPHGSRRARSTICCSTTAARPAGVATADGRAWRAGAVVLTTGTFLRGEIHLGLERWPAGRARRCAGGAAGAEPRARGLRAGAGSRPARRRGSTAARSTIARLARQPGDDPAEPFSTLTTGDHATRRSTAHITATTAATHAADPRQSRPVADVCRPASTATGARYCPSIEDKVVRFADRDAPPDLSRARRPRRRHGLSRTASRPRCRQALQARLLATIPGLEQRPMLRPGYAIEYDHVDPRELDPTLETRRVPRLYPRRPDQRHDRLRGGGGAGAGRRHQRRAGGRPARAAGRSTAPTPISAC